MSMCYASGKIKGEKKTEKTERTAEKQPRVFWGSPCRSPRACAATLQSQALTGYAPAEGFGPPEGPPLTYAAAEELV